MNYIANFKKRVPKRISNDPRSKSPMTPLEERRVSNIVRRNLLNAPYLLHGTMLGSKIIRTNTLLSVDYASEAVSFTRDAATAVHFSNLPHDWNDGFGTVFCFDRRHLNSNFKIELVSDLDWPKFGSQGMNEMEERITNRDISLVSRYCRRVLFIFWGILASTDSWPEARRFANLLRDIVRFKRYASDCHERKLELISQTFYLPMPIKVRLVAVIAGAKSA